MDHGQLKQVLSLVSLCVCMCTQRDEHGVPGENRRGDVTLICKEVMDTTAGPALVGKRKRYYSFC